MTDLDDASEVDESTAVDDPSAAASEDPDDPSPDAESAPTLVRSGRNFEREYRLDASEAGTFLVELGEKLGEGAELRLATDEWELPFAFGEPVELEIDFEGTGEPKLEIEVELPGRTDDTAPDVR
ncbi:MULTISPECIES: amphi-Trp domain-containing protein [Haloferacaceae]|uniref:Amphi-Trp domain-containing protein n=1 Tax=Halorubrum glutamatedens TaxID=2707018 RepID=A0ABD5QSD6_9EURY|nr:amphi-Trp domain-containing protein [Halobellus captivus]